MQVHHIFIFTDDNGAIADELVRFGLAEGSSRMHPGQGTRNRKFYFENFFLEILWVYDEAEIQTELIKSTGLWQRSEFRKNNFSPFGLCIVNEDCSDLLFENAFQYQPGYFPPGMTIDVLKNENQPALPWTFRIPFKGQSTSEGEPFKHPNGINRLTKTIFEYRDSADRTFLSGFENENTILFRESSRTWLNLIFDNGKQGLKRDFELLQLTIEY